MPIELPLAPEGIDLPAMPSNPPTLDDVIQARLYQADVNVAFGQSLPPLAHQILSDIYPVSQLDNTPTEADTARAEIYKTTIVMAHSAAGRSILFMQTSYH